MEPHSARPGVVWIMVLLGALVAPTSCAISASALSVSARMAFHEPAHPVYEGRGLPPPPSEATPTEAHEKPWIAIAALVAVAGLFTMFALVGGDVLVRGLSETARATPIGAPGLGAIRGWLYLSVLGLLTVATATALIFGLIARDTGAAAAGAAGAALPLFAAGWLGLYRKMRQNRAGLSSTGDSPA